MFPIEEATARYEIKDNMAIMSSDNCNIRAAIA
jgi:hypothetical protein